MSKPQRIALSAPGFGALFAYGLAKALVAPFSDSELLAPSLRAPTAPASCPVCGCPATGACRDPKGDWTWCCFGGCNP